MFRLRLVERVKVFALLHPFVKLFSLGDICTHVGLSLRLFGGKSFRACTKKSGSIPAAVIFVPDSEGKCYSITLGNKDGGGKRSSSARTSRLFGSPREGIAAKTLCLRRCEK